MARQSNNTSIPKQIAEIAQKIISMSCAGQPLLIFSQHHNLLFHEILTEVFMSKLCANNKCSTCDDCRLVLDASHPAIFSYDALSSKNKINIATLRTYIQRMQNYSDKNYCYILIIFNFNLLRQQLQNTLLKFIEELPDNNTVLFFGNDNVAVQPTVSSRCFIYNFTTEYKSILKYFCKLHKCSVFDYYTIYRLANDAGAFSYYLESDFSKIAQNCALLFLRKDHDCLTNPLFNTFYKNTSTKKREFLYLFLSAYIYKVLHSDLKADQNKYNETIYLLRALAANRILSLKYSFNPLLAFHSFISSHHEKSAFFCK